MVEVGRVCLSIEEARRKLGISRALAYSGVLPTIRLGRRLLVPVKALEDLLEGGRKEGKSEENL